MGRGDGESIEAVERGRRDRNAPAHARPGGICKGLLDLAREIRKCEMAVRVDHGERYGPEDRYSLPTGARHGDQSNANRSGSQ